MQHSNCSGPVTILPPLILARTGTTDKLQLLIGLSQNWRTYSGRPRTGVDVVGPGY